MNDTNLLVEFTKPEIPSLYENWSWLIETSDLGNPLAMTMFGDLFFKKPDGHIYLLDSFEGTVIDFAENDTSFQHKLNQAETEEQYLFSSLIKTLREKGVSLKENELYIFKVHPILGGEATSDNVEIMSMRVVISLLGQLHQQANQS